MAQWEGGHAIDPPPATSIVRDLGSALANGLERTLRRASFAGTRAAEEHLVASLPRARPYVDTGCFSVGAVRADEAKLRVDEREWV